MCSGVLRKRLLITSPTERVEIVPCDDGWPEYEEQDLDFYKVLKPQVDTCARNKGGLVEKGRACLRITGSNVRICEN